MVQGIDVEIAKVDPARRAWSLACKNDFGIGKDVMEEIKLDVFTSEWLGIVTLYRQSLSTEITNKRDGVTGPARVVYNFRVWVFARLLSKGCGYRPNG